MQTNLKPKNFKIIWTYNSFFVNFIDIDNIYQVDAPKKTTAKQFQEIIQNGSV